MAWFRNHYICTRCNDVWTDEWSCMSDDDCPNCGCRHLSPMHSDDLSVVIEKVSPQKFVVSFSPPSAEQSPDYSHAEFDDEVSANSYADRIMDNT